MKLSTCYSCVLLLIAAIGCGDNLPAPVEATLGGLTVRVEPAPARLVISAPDGTVLIDGLPGGSAGEAYPAPHVAGATRSSQPSIDFQVGAFRIEENQPDPWKGVRRFSDIALSGDAISFVIHGDGGRLGTGKVSAAGDGHVRIELDFTGDVNRASMSFGCNPGEHFLGFGGQTAAVDHHGFTLPLWVQEDGISKAPVDSYDYGVWFLMGRLHSTHTPMPMYLSSRGYGFILDTPYRSIFDMCEQDADAVRVEAWEPRIDAHVFYGPNPKQIIEKMTGFVGRPELPPAFAFAPWLDAIYGQDNVRRVAQQLRADDVPASVIWTEDWRGGMDAGSGYVLDEDWEVDRDLYPDFETLADDIHSLGYKFLIYNNTFLDSRVPAFTEAVAGDYEIPDDAGDPYLFTGVKFSDTTMLDLSNPDARTWAKGKYRAGLELGTDGYMADYGEWLPTDAVLDSGEDAMKAHNLYPVEWARLNKELFDQMHAEDGVDRLYFMRAAYLRSQPLVSVMWAGDQQTDFTADDGYDSVIPIGIGLGVTGFPYFGSDIAGYMSQGTTPVTKELWFRWVTFGALSPVMRTHHGRSAKENWNWESDAASTAHFRRWAKLHIRLFPYLNAMAEVAHENGTPMFRSLAIDHPDFDAGWGLMDEYALGDRLIVAPIMTEGATSRSMWLPPGTYYPLAGGDVVDAGVAGKQIDVDATIDEIPVFVPAGAMLVLLPDDIDTLVDADATSGAVTLADEADDRELWLWPGGTSELTEVGGSLSYSWDAGTLAGAPTQVMWNGQAVTAQSDADGDYYDVTGPGTLTMDGGATLTVTGGANDRVLRVRLR